MLLPALQVFGSKDGPASSGPDIKAAEFGQRKKGGVRPNLDIEETLEAINGFMQVRVALLPAPLT